jgi:hypothetical protein
MLSRSRPDSNQQRGLNSTPMFSYG